MKKFGRYPRERVTTGFTLIELMVVMVIIALLIGILIPVVRKVKIQSQIAATKVLISKLQGAVERYSQDFNAYPGPLGDGPNAATGEPYAGGAYSKLTPISPVPSGFSLPAASTNPVPAAAPAEGAAITAYQSITGTNNLVLGLLGGLYYDATAGKVQYNPALVGSGPSSLNPANLRANTAYVDTQNLSWHDDGQGRIGNFVFAGGSAANDCPIPSFVDSFTDQLPILYLRCRHGASAAKVSTAGTNDPATLVAGYNGAPVVNSSTLPPAYDLGHVLGYTSSNIGFPGSLTSGRVNTTAGMHGMRYVEAASRSTFDKSASGSSKYVYPFDLNVVVADPNQTGVPRAKDTYILLSAGPDRIYGTNDDIASFGDLQP